MFIIVFSYILCLGQCSGIICVGGDGIVNEVSYGLSFSNFTSDKCVCLQCIYSSITLLSCINKSVSMLNKGFLSSIKLRELS